MSAIHKAPNGKVVRRPLRALMIEDSEADAFLLERALERGGFVVTAERVDTAEAMETALARREWDVLFVDHSMPRFSAPEALELMKQKKLDLPFIIVSGHIEEVTAVAAMQAGAHDFIMKDRLGRLVPAVERELREAEVRRALRHAHDELEMRVEKRTADLRAANQKLRDVLEERARLENELLEIAENERRRIGFDLHDDLGQRLTGMLLMTRALEQRLTHDKHAHAEDAGKIACLIEQTIHHTHNLAHQCSSLDAAGDDPVTVLKGVAANVRKMFDVSCAFSVKGEIPSVPPNVTMQLCKIAQEAVSNAIKHGKATQVLISLTESAEKLALTIRNDGVPFSPATATKGRMGLRIMNYRANTIGAAFDIKPNHKNGTIVTCTLHVKTAKPHRNGVETHAEPPAESRARKHSGEAMAHGH